MRIMGEPENNGQEELPPDGNQREERGGTRRMFFAAILIVLALFGYLYFFTDMIKSHQEPQSKSEALVRKPLPRKGGPLGAISTSVKSAVTGVTPAKTGAKSGDVSRKAGQATPEKPAPAPVPKQIVSSPPLKPLPAMPAPQVALPAVKPQPHKATLPAVTTVKPPVKPEPAAKPEPVAAGVVKYALQCGPFATIREVAPARAALKKAGLTPVSSPGPKRPTLMYRLFVAGYSDAEVATVERNKLLEVTPDAFVLRHDGNYELFAGSYHEEGRAGKMEDHLSAQGIKVERRQVTAPVATRLLTAGVFPNQEAAGAVAERLKKNGIACTVTQQGR